LASWQSQTVLLDGRRFADGSARIQKKMKQKNAPIQVVVSSLRICLSPRPESQTEDEEPKPDNIELKMDTNPKRNALARSLK